MNKFKWNSFNTLFNTVDSSNGSLVTITGSGDTYKSSLGLMLLAQYAMVNKPVSKGSSKGSNVLMYYSVDTSVSRIIDFLYRYLVLELDTAVELVECNSKKYSNKEKEEYVHSVFEGYGWELKIVYSRVHDSDARNMFYKLVCSGGESPVVVCVDSLDMFYSVDCTSVKREAVNFNFFMEVVRESGALCIALRFKNNTSVIEKCLIRDLDIRTENVYEGMDEVFLQLSNDVDSFRYAYNEEKVIGECYNE